jgi:CHAT domain-containing protein
MPTSRLYPLKQLALCCQELGHYQSADSIYNTASTLARELNDSPSFAWINTYQADARLRQGDTTGVRKLLIKSENIFACMDSTKYRKGLANCRYHLGRLDRMAKNYSSAIDILNLSLNGFVDIRDSIYAVKELAGCLLDASSTDSALYYFDLVHQLIKQVRANIPRSELRKHYLSDKYDAVQGQIYAYLATGEYNNALDLAEDFRAQSLYEALNEKQHRTEWSETFIRNKERIEKSISSYLNDIRSCSFSSYDSLIVFVQLQALQDSLVDAYLVESSRYPIPPQRLCAGHQSFIDLNTPTRTALYYFAYAGNIMVWYVENDSLKVLDVSRHYPETTKLIEQALTMLTVRPATRAALDSLNIILDNLSCLLPVSVQKRLSELDTIEIYTAGILSYFPFETIRINSQYLGQTLPLEYYPSLSIRYQERQTSQVANRLENVAIFGGTFPDSNVNNCQQFLPGILQSYQHLTELPGVLKELEVISELSPGDVNSFIGRTDQEEIIRNRQAGDCDIWHFATHGIVSDDYPELSGLVLPFKDNNEHDEILLVGEIPWFQIDVPLVVLSACRTGRGKIVTGEGILGLSRSFLIAGASSLVVSLWPVDDVVTSHLIMKPFYRALFQGESTAKALQRARSEAIEGQVFAHPYYWASLVSIGNWQFIPSQ